MAAIAHPEVSRNRALIVNSFTATPHEMLAEFERQTGGQKWTVEYTSLAELKELEEQFWLGNSPTATGYTLKRIWTEGSTLYETRDNEALGITEVDGLGDAVRDIIEKKGTFS